MREYGLDGSRRGLRLSLDECQRVGVGHELQVLCGRIAEHLNQEAAHNREPIHERGLGVVDVTLAGQHTWTMIWS